MITDNCYYVYIYLNPLKKGIYTYGPLTFNNEPIYVGKGKKDRLFIHIKYPDKIKNNPAFKKTLKEYKSIGVYPDIQKIQDNLSEEDAFNLERKIISSIGRKCSKDGPLLNLTEGGDGHSKPPSEKWISWLSDYNKKIGRWVGDNNPSKKRNCSGSCNGFSGKKHTEEARLKMSNSRTGKISPLKGRKVGPSPLKGKKGRISTQRKRWLLIDFFGQELLVDGLYTFCKDKPLVRRYLKDVSLNKRRSYKGIDCYDLSKISLEKAKEAHKIKKFKKPVNIYTFSMENENVI